MILNLTQHAASEEQIEAGVVEPASELKDQIRKLLTFEELPEISEIFWRADQLADIADGTGSGAAMIGGAPFLMASLERALWMRNIQPRYAFSRRESVEEKQDDGSVRKVAIFRHLGFIHAHE